jgi:putative FmdB family regulatory protein
MPAYEYLCDGCAARFEQRQKMSDAAIERCPQCGGSVHRLISGGAGAITKGATAPAPMPACASGGACCGGICNPGVFSEN